MNTIIETIRAEIKRLISNEMELMKNSTEKCGDYPPSSDIMLVAYQCVLSFLDTLQEQPVCEGLEEEIERYLHSLGVGYGGWVDGMEDDDLRGIARHFAQWQKEQMMKEAVDVQVVGEQRDLRLTDSTQRCLFNANRGDWLKIIIVKED